MRGNQVKQIRDRRNREEKRGEERRRQEDRITGGRGRIVLIRWEGRYRFVGFCRRRERVDFSERRSPWRWRWPFIRLVLNGEPVPEPGPDT